jgi:hypothetical protein
MIGSGKTLQYDAAVFEQDMQVMNTVAELSLQPNFELFHPGQRYIGFGVRED